MYRYIIRRLIAMPLLLLGIVSIAFLITHFTKGDPLISIIGERQMDNPIVIAAAKARWGLDRSLPEQYLIYVGNLLTGDLGTSLRTKQGVGLDLLQRLPATLELVVAAMLVGSLIGVTLGVAAAHYRDRAADHFARLFALIGSSLPVFWSGLILLFIFWYTLGVLPGPGRLDTRSMAPPYVTGFYTIDSLVAGDLRIFAESISHLILPACVLGWAVMGIISRLVRASMLDVLNQDYILAARAKGASEPRVLVNHALRNALIPTLTIVGFSFAYLITGAVLSEAIFSWPGMGSYAVDAARNLDYPAIMGVTIVGGAAFLLTNLVTDIAYAFVDPRIRFG
ncbi:MAG TPA: ABC transporter permease [Candidatus Angelobacter sp.]|nr:ABC transporter permease [Candidatus Angelobacter sp.]